MGSVIKVQEDYQMSEELAEVCLFMLNTDRESVPTFSIFEIIAAKARPGMSAEIFASSVVNRFEEVGIPTGSLEGGAPNVMENFVKVFSEEIVDMIRTQMRVDVAVDVGIPLQVAGANGGGPLTAIGASIAPHTATGVAS